MLRSADWETHSLRPTALMGLGVSSTKSTSSTAVASSTRAGRTWSTLESLCGFYPSHPNQPPPRSPHNPRQAIHVLARHNPDRALDTYGRNCPAVRWRTCYPYDTNVKCRKCPARGSASRIFPGRLSSGARSGVGLIKAAIGVAKEDGVS